jgi:Ca2+-binding RTX toxin-like protein
MSSTARAPRFRSTRCSASRTRGSNNRINGGGGRDALIGNGGRDEFLFDTPLEPTVLNTGRILDFTRGIDLILLENTAFDAFAGRSRRGAVRDQRATASQ